MYHPNKRDSIVTKYAAIIEENRQRRKQLGEFEENEPEVLIFDDSYINDVDENGNALPSPPWEYTNLISVQCVQDIFGEDYYTIQKLLLANPIIFNKDNGSQLVYYRESEISHTIEILTVLAKSHFVNSLRPQYQFIKDDEPVYNSKDLMKILDIKEERLRKFREEGYLGYTKYRGSDKIWYTKQNLQDFLNNPEAVHKPWK